METQQNATISVDDLMQRIRAEVAQRKAGITSNGTATVNTLAPDDMLQPDGANTQSTPRPDLAPLRLSMPKMTFVAQTQPLDLPRPTPLPDQASYHVRDFLPFNEAEFIRVAHRAILRREADTSNLTNFLSSWHEGASKVYLLGQMRYSEEGEQRAVPITGLRSRFLLEQAYRLPLIGYLLRWLVSLLTLPKRLRTLSRFADRILVNEQYLATLSASLIRDVTAQYYNVLGLQNNVQANFNDWSQQINQYQAVIHQSLNGLETRMSAVQQDNTQVRQSVNGLETRMSAVQQDNTQVRQSVNGLEARLSVTQQYNEELRDSLLAIEDIEKKTDVIVDTLRQAFTAQTSAFMLAFEQSLRTYEAREQADRLTKSSQIELFARQMAQQQHRVTTLSEQLAIDKSEWQTKINSAMIELSTQLAEDRTQWKSKIEGALLLIRESTAAQSLALAKAHEQLAQMRIQDQVKLKELLYKMVLPPLPESLS